MSRPNTLSAISDRIRAGTSLSVAVPEFLDEFYAADEASRLGMIAEEPSPTGSATTDALLGAVCEYLAKRYALPRVPGWAGHPRRFLDEPWFTTPVPSDGMREYLSFTSPAEFQHRNIFTEAEPLRRASLRAVPGSTIWANK